MIKDVTDLEVYQLSLMYVGKIHTFTNRFSREYSRIKFQMRGAAEAISPQIAEGFGKKKAPREFCRFLSMALGSSDEVIAHLREVKIIIPSAQKESDELIDLYKILSKMLNRLLTSWQKFS